MPGAGRAASPEADLERLYSPLGGLVARAGRLLRTHDPPLSVHYAELGDLRALGGAPGGTGRDDLVGIGVAEDDSAARAAALAEALERYAAHAVSPEQLLLAAADDLSDALDLAALPRCSERERADPRCPVADPDPAAAIRWVRGLSLTTGRPLWVPAVLVYLGLAPLPSERFTLATSAGCAAAATIERATLVALCELVEREAVALTWLQQLPLPELDLADAPSWLRDHVAPRNTALRRRFFDATTDLGVPTVYAVETAEDRDEAATMVACAADPRPHHAVAKVVRDLAGHRASLELPRELPEDPAEFVAAWQGARYMGRAERREAFAFLLDRPGRVLKQLPPPVESIDDAGELASLVARFRARSMEVAAVDLSTDEALRAGARVVRVVVPQLQPLTFRMTARYLAHPRLYEAPRSIGCESRTEVELNPRPQPFG